MEAPIPRDQKRKMDGEQISTSSKKIKRASDASIHVVASTPIVASADQHMQSSGAAKPTTVLSAADESLPSAFAEEGTGVPPAAVAMSLLNDPTELQQDPGEPVSIHGRTTMPDLPDFAKLAEKTDPVTAPTKTEETSHETTLPAQADCRSAVPSESLAPHSTADSRTPSLNLQLNTTSTSTNATSTTSGTVSASPPSSPLSDLNPSSPLLAPMNHGNNGSSTAIETEPMPRTPRERKPVDRFSFTAPDVKRFSPHQPSAAATKDGFMKPAGRKSSGPSRSVSREKSMGNMSSPSSVKKERQTSVASAMSPRSPEEEETLKLVRELSGKEFGLRRRKESSG